MTSKTTIDDFLTERDGKKDKKKWRKVRLGSILDVQNGYAFDSKLFGEKGFPIVRIRNLKSGFTNTRYSGEFDDKFVIDSGDFLIGMDGEFKCYKWKGGKSLLNQRVCKLINFADDVVPEYIYQEISSRTEQAKKLRQEALKDTEAIMQSVLHKTFLNAEEKWETKSLEDIVDFKGGGTPSKKNPDYWNGEIPWLSDTARI